MGQDAATDSFVDCNHLCVRVCLVLCVFACALGAGLVRLAEQVVQHPEASGNSLMSSRCMH